MCYRYFHVDFDRLALLETEIQGGSARLFADLFLLFQPFEVVLEGDVQIERVGSVAEADTDKRLSACK